MAKIVAAYLAGEQMWSVGVPGIGGLMAGIPPDDDPEPHGAGMAAADIARRLAACWNYCEGLTVNQLETLKGK